MDCIRQTIKDNFYIHSFNCTHAQLLGFPYISIWGTNVNKFYLWFLINISAQLWHLLFSILFSLYRELIKMTNSSYNLWCHMVCHRNFGRLFVCLDCAIRLRGSLLNTTKCCIHRPWLYTIISFYLFCTVIAMWMTMKYF